MKRRRSIPKRSTFSPNIDRCIRRRTAVAPSFWEHRHAHRVVHGSAASPLDLSGLAPVLTLIPFGVAGTTKTFGEALFSVVVPVAATGIPATLQGTVGAPTAPLGAWLTNPETLVLLP